MPKKQRLGIAILIIVLIMTSLFGSKPDLTIEIWGDLCIFSGVLGGLGGALFISN